jgi:hypothetical protein
MADVFRLFATAVTTTNTFTAFTLSTNSTAILRSITICNANTSGTASCDVIMAPTTAADVYLFRVTQVTAAATIQPLAAAVTLGPGATLKVVANTANAIHLTASYLESD